jgi:exodeoxyribonuclease VII large subunit
MRTRPVLASPDGFLIVRRDQWRGLVQRMRTHISHQVERANLEVHNLRSTARLLSPASTLDRGYAIVQHDNGMVVRRAAELSAQELLTVRVASGSFTATVEQITDERTTTEES